VPHTQALLVYSKGKVVNIRESVRVRIVVTWVISVTQMEALGGDIFSPSLSFTPKADGLAKGLLGGHIALNLEVLGAPSLTMRWCS